MAVWKFQDPTLKNIEIAPPKSAAMIEGSILSVDAQKPKTILPTAVLITAARTNEDVLSRAYSARTAIGALDILNEADEADPMVVGLLKLIRTTCRPASTSVQNSLNLASRSGFVKNHNDASKAYLTNYCGDVGSLVHDIDAKIEIVAQAKLEPPKESQDLAKLMEAGIKSSEVADAVVNEILMSRDPDKARNLAMMLSAGLEPGGALVKWREFFPPLAGRAEYIQAFTNAGELIACQHVGGCGPNQPLSFFTCLMAQSCLPNEDLVAYRRRTTSPMLFQAAERIAAEMQVRRYRGVKTKLVLMSAVQLVDTV